MTELPRVERDDLEWRLVVDDVEQARVSLWKRPDGRYQASARFEAPEQLAGLLLELVSAIRAEVLFVVDATSTAAVDACERAAFLQKRREIEYALDVPGATAALATAVWPSGVTRLSWENVDRERLRRLDDRLRQDVPGTDGWRWTVAGFDAECTGPHLDPDTYVVAVDADDYLGLCRVWRREGRPSRIGMVGVVHEWRRRGLARALLADAMRSCTERADSVTLEIDETNAASTALFHGLGAVPIGVAIEMSSLARR